MGRGKSRREPNLVNMVADILWKYCFWPNYSLMMTCEEIKNEEIKKKLFIFHWATMGQIYEYSSTVLKKIIVYFYLT